MTRLIVLLPLILLACGRPLTPQETEFASTLMGSEIQTSKARLINGALIGKVKHTYLARPQVACRERIWPAPKTKTVQASTAAFVLFNTLFVAQGAYEPNYLPAYPDQISLPHAMFLAHELTHVWQWQNREITNYHPFKAAREHKPGTDPYQLDLGARQNFLDYPYEQQGAIVEEYVCCRTLDPKGARTKRLRDMLSPVFPLDKVEPLMSRPTKVRLWKGTRIKGICS